MAKPSMKIVVTELEPVKTLLTGLVDILEEYKTQGLINAEDAMLEIDFIVLQFFANLNAEKVEEEEE